MSQQAHEQSNAKNAPMTEQQKKKEEPPVGGVSPNDPIGITIEPKAQSDQK